VVWVHFCASRSWIRRMESGDCTAQFTEGRRCEDADGGYPREVELDEVRDGVAEVCVDASPFTSCDL
jgi:hypothetical protein